MTRGGKHVWTALFVVICLVYAWLRFWHLADSCLWFDEIFGVHAATLPWNELFRFVAQDLIHPPLFYVLLKTWIALGGESVFWLRLFPVVFSILALFPFYQICRALKLKPETVAVALAFFAANGALIKYAQEVRMYSLLLCFSLVSIWLFNRFFNLGKSFSALVVFNVLLVYTHYFGWFTVLSEVLIVLIWQRIKIRQILLMFGVTILSYAPWIFALAQAGRASSDVAQNIGWMSRPDLTAIVQFAFDLIEPFYFQASSIDWASVYYISIPLLWIIAAAKIVFVLEWNDKSAAEKQSFRLLNAFFAVPVILAFAASWILPHSIWGTRHLIVVFAPAAILLAKFLTEIEIKILKPIFASLIFALFAAAFALQANKPEPQYIWCAWENLATKIDREKTPKIYVYEDLAAYHLWFAQRENRDVQIVRVKDVPEIIEDRAYFLPRGFDAVQTARETEIGGDRFYIVFRDTVWNENRPPLKNLIEIGYKIGEPQIYEAQGLKAFLVEIKK